MLFVEVRCDLQVTVQRHFFEDVVNVTFHRLGGKVQPRRDFVVAHLLGNQDEPRFQGKDMEREGACVINSVWQGPL